MGAYLADRKLLGLLEEARSRAYYGFVYIVRVSAASDYEI